ncbi:MAG: AraC family transcriptional regulator [Clostridium sp.]|nr:AraC family transcriptional regulator [Bacteroides sp.]MCM1198896.1 AraC family transcriptional regulator [Clostridium sp.]
MKDGILTLDTVELSGRSVFAKENIYGSVGSRIPPTFFMHPHSHPFHQISYTLHNGYFITIDNMTIRCHEDDIIMIGAGTAHLPHTGSGQDFQSEKHIIQFTEGIFPVTMDSVPEMSNISRLLETGRKGCIFRKGITGGLFEMFRETEKAEGIERIISLLRLLDRLGGISGQATRIPEMTEEQSDVEIRNAPAVERCYFYIRRHFQERITLKDIAGYAGQNPSALCRSFKMQKGISIFNYIQYLRIEKACRLLQDASGMSIEEIIYECGFDSPSNFSRQFRRLCGKSASEYRKSFHSR